MGFGPSYDAAFLLCLRSHIATLETKRVDRTKWLDFLTNLLIKLTSISVGHTKTDRVFGLLFLGQKLSEDIID